MTRNKRLFRLFPSAPPKVVHRADVRTKDFANFLLLLLGFACEQTSPLPHEKKKNSGEETSVHRSLHPISFLREGRRLYTGYAWL